MPGSASRIRMAEEGVKLDKDEKRKVTVVIILLACIAGFLVLEKLAGISWFDKKDVALLKGLDPLRIHSAIPFFTFMTQLGSSKVLLPLIAVFMFFFIGTKRFLSFVVLPLAFLLQHWLNDLLKNTVMRARPPLHHLIHVSGYSFPSGHAMNAMAVYGTLAVLLWFQLRNKTAKIVTAVFGAILIVLIGISRVFLAVHYVSDVIAGFCVSGAIVCFVALLLIFQHAHREKNPPEKMNKKGSAV